MQDNKIEGDSDELIRMLVLMPSLACLYLQGNPIVGSLRHYRKRVISQVATLTYLDDRPISALERTCAEAWASGGVRSEHDARNSYKAAEEVKMKESRVFGKFEKGSKYETHGVGASGQGGTATCCDRLCGF